MSLEDMEIEESDINFDEGDDKEYENFGELIMTVKSFITNCNRGAFIDYDGYGELLDSDMKKTGIYILPSERDKIPEVYTHNHIAWYNK